jgi:tripartite-type tricarboxylate transporter receptor subunit TctC
MKELVEMMKKNPGKMNYSSGGYGTPAHLVGELFKLETKVDVAHVPYQVIPQAIQDLIGKRLAAMVLPIHTALPLAEAGRVRLLGVGTATRVSLKPDLPTIQEQGVADYAVRSWTGAFLQRGTPRAIIETLSAAFKEALETPLARTRLRDIGSEPLFMDPAATDAFVREEYTRWGPVVRAANIRIE